MSTKTVSNLDNLTKNIQEKLNKVMESMVNKKFAMEMKEQSIMTMPEIYKIVNECNQASATVYIPLVGDVIGDMFLFLFDRSAETFADMMIGNEVGTTRIIGDYEISALKEFGNISIGLIVSELANLLELSIMLTTPNYAADMPGALVDQALISYGETSNTLLAIKFDFELKSPKVSGSYLILFDEDASKLIRDKIKTK